MPAWPSQAVSKIEVRANPSEQKLERPRAGGRSISPVALK